mgnify:CR=1 FL=1
MDLEDVNCQLAKTKLLGCKGTTGTQASFLELFEGDQEKCRELDRKIAAEMNFAATGHKRQFLQHMALNDLLMDHQTPGYVGIDVQNGMELFEGDQEKCRELDRKIAAEMNFAATASVSGQTYSRKVDGRLLAESSKVRSNH